MAASYIEALLPAPFDTGVGIKDWRWNNSSPVGTADTVTFRFLTSTTLPAHADSTGFLELTDPQKTATRTILGLYEEISKIDFVEKTGNTNADLLIGRNNLSPVGYAYYPELFPDTTPDADGGDVWISKVPASNLDVAPGEPGWQTLIHEIGHAIGLKHPFEVDDPQPALPDATDNHRYTVMSYTPQARSLWRTVTDLGGGSYSFDYEYIGASTPMLYDVAAVQYLYGKNMATRTGNDTYAFDPDAPFFKCIWDAGGNDTISVANFTLGCTINLTAGQFSSIVILPDAMPPGYGADPNEADLYNGTNNLSIAYGASIENATGGSGNDKLTGNALGNVLTGNGGNDVLNGGAGNDTMVGGAGNDTYSVNAGTDVVTEAAAAGSDVVQSAATYTLPANVERLTLTGTAAINGTGNGLANVLTGNSGNNVLNGGGGADTVKGMDGNDQLVWDPLDTYDGGVGAGDVLRLAGANVTLNLLTVASTKILNVEVINLTGTGNNRLELSAQDVLDLSSTTNTLRVDGNAGDTVDRNAGWLQGANQVIGANTYRAYTQGGATLLVDTDISSVV